MLGASRDSLSRASAVLEARRAAPGFDRLSGELFSVAGLLSEQPQLLSVLADSGQPAAARSGLVRDIFASRVSELAVETVTVIVGERWSSDGDLVLAIEQIADQAAFAVAQSDGTLDATEDELFRFGRALDQSPELQMALTDPAQSPQVKAGIVRDLLRGRATAATTQVLEYAVGHLHGERIDSVVSRLCDLAAQERSRVVALVRVAAAMEPEQERRLADILSRMQGREVRLNIAVDPSVLGGVSVQIGDEVIDGTVASRLEQARRAVLGS